MPALGLGLDDRDDQLGAVDHPAEVDGHGLVPAVELRVVGGPAAVHAGVVAEHVDPAEDGQRLLHRRLEVAAFSHIGAYEGDRVVALERGLRLLDVLHVPVGDHDFHPFGKEGADHAKADPVGAAGDEGHLSRQILHDSLLFGQQRRSTCRAAAARASRLDLAAPLYALTPRRFCSLLPRTDSTGGDPR